MFYGLRQAALIVPLVLILLNVNIYVSRRGRYLNGSTSPADPVYYSMWLTAPLVCCTANGIGVQIRSASNNCADMPM